VTYAPAIFSGAPGQRSSSSVGHVRLKAREGSLFDQGYLAGTKLAQSIKSKR
jgi:hypothetical protein